MSSSSSSASKPSPPLLRLHVDTAAATATNGSAASPGSASSSHSSRSPRPSSAAGPGGGQSQNQNQACAACKYQRRKCNPDCPLAPYFPADQQRRFLNAHRLFGVKNIQKTLRWIDPERGPDAMRALIYQSEARAADPVGGCVTIIEQLQRQIERTELELSYVNQQIAIYRQQAAAVGVDPLADPAMILPAAAAVAGQDHQDNNAAGAVGALYAGQQPVLPAGAGLVFQDQQGYHVVKVDDDQQNHPQPPPQQLYNYFCYDATADDEASSQDGSEQQYGGFADTGGLKIGSPVALGEQLEQHCRLQAAPPFVDAFDVKPQGLRETTERHCPADLLHPEDQHMEEEATMAAAPCHLELGFSSI